MPTAVSDGGANNKYSTRSPPCGNVRLSPPIPIVVLVSRRLRSPRSTCCSTTVRTYLSPPILEAETPDLLIVFLAIICIPKLTPHVQSAALPWMVQAKLVHLVELYVPTNKLSLNFLAAFFSISAW